MKNITTEALPEYTRPSETKSDRWGCLVTEKGQGLSPPRAGDVQQWYQQQGELQKRLFDYAEIAKRNLHQELRIMELRSRTLQLESKMQSLSDRVRTLEANRMQAYLSSLGVSGLCVTRPIPVTFRPDGDEFIATFFDANISSGGGTEQEALSNLQSLIADLFDDVVNIPDEHLGKSMRRQKRVLAEFICRT